MQYDNIEAYMYGTDPYVRWYGKLFSPRSHTRKLRDEDVYGNGTLKSLKPLKYKNRCIKYK